MGVIFEIDGSLDEAINSYSKALQINPDYAIARTQKLHQQAYICDWQAIENDRAHLVDLGIVGGFVSPFSILSLEDSPEKIKYEQKILQMQCFLKMSRP